VRPITLSSSDTVYRRSDNPILGFELRPDYRNEDADLHTSYPRTNAHGFRDRERTLAKPEGGRRIVMLGDSVTEGVGIRAVEDTLSGQLERLYGGACEVLNLGISGYCTRAEVELLEVKGLGFDPDVVVVVFVENDFDNFNRELFEMGQIERPALVEFLFLRSHLFRLACLELDVFRFGVEADPLAWNREAIGDNNVVEGLDRLRTLADEQGFETLIAIWPRFEHDGIVDTGFMSEGGGELVIERLATLFGLETVRLSTPLTSHWRSNDPARSPRSVYTLGDGMHPSVQGCLVAAEALKATLERPRARRARQERDPAAAARAMALATAEPDRAVVESNIGLEHQKQGRHESAIARFRAALEINPRLAMAHNNLGNSLRALGRDDEAIVHWRKAAEIDPESTGAFLNLAELFRSRGRPVEAMAELRQALERRPDMVEAHVALGDLLFVERRLGEAGEHYRRALEQHPELGDAHNNLGMVYQLQGDTDRAIEQFRDAARLSPADVNTHTNLGIALRSKGELEEAIEHLARAVQIAPGLEEGHEILAQTLLEAGRADEALASLREVIRLQPEAVGAMTDAAFILATHDDPNVRDGAEAVRLARRAAERTGHAHPIILSVLAHAYAADGQLDAAAASAEAALELAVRAGDTRLADRIRDQLEQMRQLRPGP
jgi:tetratricopeptide (TPR) repeat protein